MATFVILEPVPKEFLNGLKELGYEPVLAYELDEASRQTHLAKATGLLIRSKSQVDKDLLALTPALKFILRPGSGLGNVDLSAAKEKGITIINSPEGNRNAVAEHTLGMLLGLLHKIPKAYHEIKTGHWIREANRGQEVANLTIGIIGFGHTGEAFAEKIQSLGVNTLVYDKYKGLSKTQAHTPVSLETLQQEADIISFHVPYNAETHHYFGHHFIAQLAKPVYVINTSRGEIVDNQALLAGIEQGTVKGACLDVVENEATINSKGWGDTFLDQLTDKENVLITPHTAGWSYRSEKAIYQLLLDQLKNL